MYCWPVIGETSCSGPSFVDRRTFCCRPYGVRSHGSVGAEITVRSVTFEEMVHGFDTDIVNSNCASDTEVMIERSFGGCWKSTGSSMISRLKD